MVAKDSLLSFSSTDVQKLHARGKVPFFSCSCKTTAPQEKRLLCVFVLGIMGSAHLQVSRVIFFLFFFFFWCDWKYFAAIIAACISRSISWIGLHSIFLACLETWYQPIRSELAFQQWLSLYQSDEETFCFQWCYSLTMGLGLLSMRTTTTETELA